MYRYIKINFENIYIVATVIESVWCKVFIWFQLIPPKWRYPPIYEKLKSAKDYTRQERETLVYNTLILLKEEPPHKSLISSIPPRCVKGNVSFVVDTNKLKSVNDILADGTGTWLNNGQHKFHYRKDGEKYIRVGRGKCDSSDIGITVHRHYYQHKSAKDFRKTITFLTGIFHSNIAETAFKANRKYCLLFKIFSLLPIVGNFGVIWMVVKELVGRNTLSGNRRRVKLNDVTEISDFHPTKLKRLTVWLTRQSQKGLNID